MADYCLDWKYAFAALWLPLALSLPVYGGTDVLTGVKPIEYQPTPIIVDGVIIGYNPDRVFQFVQPSDEFPYDAGPFSDARINGQSEVTFTGSFTDALGQKIGVFSYGEGTLSEVFSLPYNSAGLSSLSGNIASDGIVGYFSTLSGIAYGADPANITIAQQGLAAPGFSGVTFSGFEGRFAFGSSGHAVFTASIEDPTGTDGLSYGVWVGDSYDSLELVARSLRPAPGANGQFVSFSAPVMNSGGTFAFRADLFLSDPDASDYLSTGIWTGTSAADLALAVRGGDQAPGLPQGTQGTHFTEFGNPAINATGQLAFQAGFDGDDRGAGIFAPDSSGDLGLVARTGDFAGVGIGSFTGFADPLLNNAGQVAFIGEGGITPTVGIWTNAGEDLSLKLIARAGATTPPGAPDGSRFEEFGSLNFSNYGVAAFHGTLEQGAVGVNANNDEGIWLADGYGEMVFVAREGDQLENGRYIISIGLASGGAQSGQGAALNDYGQVVYTVGTGNFPSDINADEGQVHLFTPDLHWRSWAPGNDTWANAAKWTLGLPPGQVHHVFVDPDDLVNSVLGPAIDTTVRSLTVGDGAHTTSFYLQSGVSLAATEGTTVNDHARIHAAGTLGGDLLLRTGSELLTEDTFDLSGNFTLEVGAEAGLGHAFSVGGTGGTTNAGRIDVFESFSTPGGLVNTGEIHFYNTGFHDSLVNPAGGSVFIRNADFAFDGTVASDGSIDISSGSSARFDSAFSGSGNFTGAGGVSFAGGFSNGAGWGQQSFGGDVRLESGNTLEMTIGGLMSGSGHDAWAVGGNLHAGGTLELSLGGNYIPQDGDAFQIFDAADGISGTFDQIQLPESGRTRLWLTDQLYSDGVISSAYVPVTPGFELVGRLDGNNYRAGAAYVEELGASVTFGGGKLIAGAPSKSWSSRDVSEGIVRYLDLETGVAHALELDPNDQGYALNFGYSVAVAGEHLLIGLPTSSSGRVQIYDLDNPRGSTLYYDGVSDPSINANFFGTSAVGVGDSAFLVGARGGSRAGYAYLVELNENGNWRRTTPFTPEERQSRDWFGRSLDANGQYAIIGAPTQASYEGVDRPGSAYVFDLATGDQLIHLMAEDGYADDSFGRSVSIFGQYALVGAPSIVERNVPGAAYLYTLDFGSGEANQLFKFQASDGTPGDLFGQSTALDYDFAYVGALYAGSINTERTGAVYVYDLYTGEEIYKLTADDGAPDDKFGYSLALYGDYLAVGATGTDVNGELNTGSVYLYQFVYQDQFWNGTVTEANGSLNGGSGIWDQASTNWTTSRAIASNTWQNRGGMFAGNPGTVTLGEDVTFEKIAFLVDGYRVVGDFGLVTSDGSSLYTGENVTTQLDVPILGGVGFEKRGAGTLRLTSDSIDTGDITVTHGTLEIAQGASLSGASNILVDSNLDDRKAILRVTGADSLLHVTGEGNSVRVGESRSGAFEIVDGGRAVLNNLTLGYGAGSTGLLTVGGIDSEIAISEVFIVGKSGEGRVTVENGGRLHTAGGNLGESRGNGFVSISGSNSLWESTSGITVGVSGTLGQRQGELRIEGGGTAISTNGRLGSQADSNGIATVTGNGSAWSLSEDLYVGYSGSGNLNVADGGLIQASNIHFGYREAGIGDGTITGGGRLLASTGTVTIGEEGDGTLTVSDGGKVTTRYLDLATGADSGGTLIITGSGSEFISKNRATVGAQGTGNLQVTDGGKFETYSLMVVGNSDGAAGYVTVTGENASLNTGGLSVGYKGGEGVVMVEEGAVLTAKGVTVGYGAGSFGTVTVSGSESALVSSLHVNVGSGVLNVLNGAQADLAHYNLTMGSSNASSEVFISNGGKLSSSQGSIGTLIGSKEESHQASVLVNGEGSVWSNARTMSIGNNSSESLLESSLTVSEGGQVVNSGRILVSGNGTLQLDGGEIHTQSLDLFPSFEYSFGQPGELIWNSGTLTIAGGVFRRYQLNDGSSGAAPLVIESADGSGIATLRLCNGATVENLASPDAIPALQIGNSHDGALHIEDATTLNVASVMVGTDNSRLRVAGSGAVLEVSGALNLDRGSIAVADGGRLTSASSVISAPADTSGEFVVTGADSSWENADLLIERAGRLQVENGGRVATVGDAWLRSSGSNAPNATVQGTGSAWEIGGSLHLGEDSGSTGDLALREGGRVAVSGDLHVQGDTFIEFDGGTLAVGGDARFYDNFDRDIEISSGRFEIGGLLDYAANNPEGIQLMGGTLSVGSFDAIQFADYDSFKFLGGVIEVRGDANLTLSRAADLFGIDELAENPVLELQSFDETSRNIHVFGQFSSEVPIQISGGGIRADSIGGGTQLAYGSGELYLDQVTLNIFGYQGGEGSSTLSVGAGSAIGSGQGIEVDAGYSIRLTGGTIELGEGADVVLGESRQVDLGGGGFTTLPAGEVDFISGKLRFTGDRTWDDDSQALWFHDRAPLLNASRSIEVTGIFTLLSTDGIIIDRGSLIIGSFDPDSTGRIDFRSGEFEITNGSLTIGANGPLGNNFQVPSGSTIRLPGGAVFEEDAEIEIEGNLVAGAVENRGRLTGTGRIETQALSNSGTVDLKDGSTISGSVTNQSGGTFMLVGEVRFDDFLVNQGTISTENEDTVVTFLSGFSGLGVSGPGEVVVESLLTPGASPGLMEFEGDLTLTTDSMLLIEIGGTARGVEYDAIDVVGTFSLDGDLEVLLLNDYLPAGGESFSLFSWGIAQGEFVSILLPDLGSASLAWDLDQLYESGVIRIEAAIPEASSLHWILAVLAAMGAFRRRR